MPTTLNIQDHIGCDRCACADAWGRGCKHGLLFPVMLLMAGKQDCPNFENKTIEQLKEQYELTYGKENEARRI